MTTYQKGREPAGAPVTWTKMQDTAYSTGMALLTGIVPNYRPIVVVDVADAICAAFHAAAEWRKLAEEARGDVQSIGWHDRFDAMKETFGD